MNNGMANFFSYIVYITCAIAAYKGYESGSLIKAAAYAIFAYVVAGPVIAAIICSIIGIAAIPYLAVQKKESAILLLIWIALIVYDHKQAKK